MVKLQYTFFPLDAMIHITLYDTDQTDVLHTHIPNLEPVNFPALLLIFTWCTQVEAFFIPQVISMIDMVSQKLLTQT